MQDRPDYTERPEPPRPFYHTRPDNPSENPQGDLGAFILRELLALPPAVLNPPVFRKLKGHLENYRKHYVSR
jgi:hypothetical protein